LAAQLLLEPYGDPAHACIGVARHGDIQGMIKAHARLESDRAVVIGESEIDVVPRTSRVLVGGHR
jgi:hypothetical protein